MEDYVVGVVGVGPVVETGRTGEIVIPLAAMGPFVSIDDESTAAAVGRLPEKSFSTCHKAKLSTAEALGPIF